MTLVLSQGVAEYGLRIFWHVVQGAQSRTKLGDYATLNNTFIGIEQINQGLGNHSMDTAVRSSFPNLNVSGVPIFSDHFVPQGNVFGVNTKYTAMYLSEDAAFDFSGFYSLVPLGQIGQQGVVVVGYDLVSAKSSSGFWGYNLQGNQF